jgi:hypothetical protein
LAEIAKESGIAPGLRAIRDHVRPILAIQACVLGVVAAYYLSPLFASFAGRLAAIKVAGGYGFAFVATGFAGAVMPELFKFATKDPRVHRFSEVAYTFMVFGLNGIIVDLFYQAQGQVFGTEPTVGVVAAKVLVDQTIGSILIFCPYFLIMISLYKAGFNWERLHSGFRQNSFLRQMWPILVVNWAYWIPALCGVYAMPNDLQFVLFLFVEAAWSLILVHVAKRNQGDMAQETP